MTTVGTAIADAIRLRARDLDTIDDLNFLLAIAEAAEKFIIEPLSLEVKPALAEQPGLDAGHLRLYVVRPALTMIDAWSKDAEELVMGTAAQESHLRWLKQLGTGPGIGLFQMEPFTYNDLWKSFLKVKPGLREKVLKTMVMYAVNDLLDVPVPASQMHWNLLFAAVMCRVRYLARPGTIPPWNDLPAQAAYWKKNYNTHLGDGTVEQYIENYRRLIKK